MKKIPGDTKNVSPWGDDTVPSPEKNAFHCCCTRYPNAFVLYVLLYVRTDKNTRGYKTIIPGGMIVFHPRKKTPSIQMETQKRGREKVPGREMHPELILKKTPCRESPPFPGTEQAVHGRAPYFAPRSPSLVVTPIASPGAPRAAVRGGRGAVARPPGGRWRSGRAGAP